MSNQPQPQQVTIDPEQALSLLDQAVSTIQTNRQGHEVLATCLAVLRARIVSDGQTITAQQENNQFLAAAIQDTAEKMAQRFNRRLEIDCACLRDNTIIDLTKAQSNGKAHETAEGGNDSHGVNTPRQSVSSATS